MFLKDRAPYKILFHTVLWGLSFYLLFQLFTIDYSTGKADVIYTALFHLPLIIAVYIHLYFIRYFFPKHRYTIYLTLTILLVIVCSRFYFFIFEKLVPLFLDGYFFIAYYNSWQIIQFIIAYIFLSLLLHLSVGWFILKEQELQLQKENHQVQLKNLKSQINPHFLFNSLNNIYALSGPNNPQSRNYLNKLSDALRYMIYDTEADLVPLKSEAEYLENYFEIEKLRLPDTAKVRFTKTGMIDQYMIAPLLLLPLVENSFAHCDRRSPIIEIDLKIIDETLHFTTRNNKAPSRLQDTGGVGLNNVKKRLKLIYPGRYELKIDDALESFQIFLTINLTDK